MIILIKEGVAMKKKIKDLTSEEMDKICIHHTQGGFVYCEYSKCPLWFANSCLRGFIEKIQHIEKEIEIDE